MSRIYYRFKIILASILIACIVLNLFPLTLFALDEPYYSVSDEYDFSVTRVISSRWEDHANIDFIVTNNGDTTIDNWYITTSLPYDVENIWNASIAETSDRYITISSAPQNQPIEPGCSVTFGITGYSEDDSLFDMESSFYLLNVEDVVISVEKYQATTNVYSTTETEFSGAIAITNISSELLTIENVILNSTNGLTINGNAAIEDETTLVVDSSSRNIYPSASIYINFEGTGEIPEVLDLRYTGLAFTLTEDEDNDGILDIDEFLYPEQEPEVTPIPTIAPTNTPEAESTETPTVTPEETPTATVTPSTTPEVEEPTPTPEEVTPTPTIDPVEALSDNDGDRLPLNQEFYFGTDSENYDTDSDGIGDGNEIDIGYDPLSQDSDSDGISDSNEDLDGDGIINIDETYMGTCLFAPDSDYDGITDYDEIYVYNSDPRSEDSDGDGIHDGDELILGKNPTDSSDFGITVNQTILQEINNVEDLAITSVDITMDYVGNMESSVSVDDLYNIDMYSTAIYSRIGSPLGFNSEFEFDSATVVIHYDDTMLGDTSEDRLGVLWFDEEHGVYIVQDQAVVDSEQNTVTLELEHFSTYVLVDIDEWWSAFDVPEASSGYFVQEHTDYYYVYGSFFEPAENHALTLDEYEPEVWWWWSILDSRELELVDRLSGNRYQVDSVKFGYDYTWLVQDVTDRDNDGLYDCFERDGMLLSNGTISFASTNTDDSDGDGISDLEETGNRYGIYRAEDGKITIYVNGEVVLSEMYYINASSAYFFLADYIPAAGRFRSLWIPISDPNNPDSDSDGYKDYEDARLWNVNEDIIYILYWSNNQDIADRLEDLYETEYGIEVSDNDFNSGSEFEREWGRIGLNIYSREWYENPDPDRYYYNPLAVIVNTHGQTGGGGFLAGNGEWFFSASPSGFSNISPMSELTDRRMEYLWLLVCDSASGNTLNETYCTSIAEVFADNNSIERCVYAYDGVSVSYWTNEFGDDLFVYYVNPNITDDDEERGLVSISSNSSSFSDVYIGDVMNDNRLQVLYNDHQRTGVFFDPIVDFVLG